MDQIKKIAIRAATAAAEAVNSPAAANSPAADKSPAANDDASTEDSSENEDGKALREFLSLDDEAQTARNKDKVSLASYKKKEKEEGAEAESRTGSSASSKSGKRGKSGKRAGKSGKRAGKSGKRASKTSKPQVKSADVDCDLHIGVRVLGFWPKDDGTDEGEWFEGRVQGIDYVERTVDILYEDGDRDDAVPWDKTRILDPISDESDG